MQKVRVTITVNLEPRYARGLKALAAREGRSVSSYLRQRIVALVDADPTVLSVPAVHVETLHNGADTHAEVA